MVMKNLIRVFACAGMVGLLPSAVATIEPPETQLTRQPLKIVEQVTPVYPAKVVRQGITSGAVHVFIEVDRHGRLADTLAAGYTHADFVEPVMVALRQWKFEPALVGGQPVDTVEDFAVRFTSAAQVTLDRHPDAAMRADLYRGFVYQACAMNELDRVLHAKRMISPEMPVAADGSRVSGAVKVDFFVDEDGNVRMPVAVSTGQDDLESAALDAIRRWRFERPLRDHRLVLVRGTHVFYIGLPAD